MQLRRATEVSEKERLVKIFMKVERKNLFIEIKNRYDGTIFKSTGWAPYKPQRKSTGAWNGASHHA